MLAVIKTGGKQYLVTPGKKIKIEKIKNVIAEKDKDQDPKGQEIVFDEVLLLENHSI